MKTPILNLILAIFAAAALPASAAEPVYLQLSMNGTQIEGEPSRVAIGGEDVSGMIECFATEHEMFDGDSSSRFRLAIGAFKIVKTLDKATPLLAQAMAQQHLGQAVFHFFRSSPGTGEIEEFLTITLENVRIVSVRTYVPNTLDPATGNSPPLEEVQFAFGSIEIAHSDGTSATISPTP